MIPETLVLFIAGLAATVIFVRLWLMLRPQTNVYFFGHNIHHLYSGALLLMCSVSLFAAGVAHPALFFVAGVASGLVSDQLVYLVISKGGHHAYFTARSFFGMLAVAAAVAGVGIATSFFLY